MKIFLSTLLFFLILLTTSAPESRFTGMSVLTGSLIITLTIISRTKQPPPYQHYLKFSEALEDKPLDQDELASKIGGIVFWDASKQENSRILNEAQKKSLERLIYDGKIIKRGGKLGLP
jgi:hypothetical protein